MSEIKKIEGFTPGPWKAMVTDDNEPYVHGANGNTVCDICTSEMEGDPKNVDGNMHLIAYAPELYSLALSQEQRIKELEDALHPLACLSLVGVTGSIVYQRDNTKILAGDVRHAKSLLTRQETELITDKNNDK